MEKQKRWQLYLIVAVLVLTIYNILPTIFFYSKPLGSPIDAPRAEQVATAAIDRVNDLEKDSIAWLHSFSNLFGVDAQSIAPVQGTPGLLQVAFKTQREADLFRKFLPKAGELIPFAPAQLELYEGAAAEPEKVLVLRQITVNLDPKDDTGLFVFTDKKDPEGYVAPMYRQLVNERAAQLAYAFAGPSKTAAQMEAAVAGTAGEDTDDFIVAIAREYVEAESAIGKSNSEMLKRYYATFAQSEGKQNGQSLVQQFVTKAEAVKTKIADQAKALADEQKKSKAEGMSSDAGQDYELSQLNNKKNTLESAIASMRKNSDAFKNTKAPLTYAALDKNLNPRHTKSGPSTNSFARRTQPLCAIPWLSTGMPEKSRLTSSRISKNSAM